jgi:hypothetical protein
MLDAWKSLARSGHGRQEMNILLAKSEYLLWFRAIPKHQVFIYYLEPSAVYNQGKVIVHQLVEQNLNKTGSIHLELESLLRT